MRKFALRLLLTLALLGSPAFVSGAGPSDTASAVIPHVTVDDVVAGFETAVHVTGSTPSRSIDLHIVSPSGEDTTIPVTADATGKADASIPARLTTEAGMYRVFAIAGQKKLGAEASFEVLSDRVDPALSHITVSHPLLPPDGRSSVTVTVTLQDTHGNPLPGRPVQLVGSRAEDRIMNLSAQRETDARGQMSFAIQTQTPGDIALRAIDLLSGTMLLSVAHISAGDPSSVGGFAYGFPAPAYAPQYQNQNSLWMPSPSPFAAQIAGSPQVASVKTYDVVDHFEIIVSTKTAKVKDVIPLVTVKAEDAAGNVVESYTGSAKMTAPTDPHATLPGLPPDDGKVKFSPKNRGVVSFPWAVTFSKSGEQTLVVTDETGKIRGQGSVTVTGSVDIPADRKILVESPKNGDTVNTRQLLVKGKGPVLANLNVWAVGGQTTPDAVTEGDPTGRAETQDDGTFSFILPLPAQGSDVMIEIQDENVEYDSGPITLHIDTDGPALKYALDPALPKEGDNVTISVTSEPTLPEVSMQMLDKKMSLTESTPGTYQVIFQAPARGETPFTLSGKDPAGNVTQVTGTLTIDGPILPQVQNVRAQSLAGGIQLTWDLIPDATLTGYRIEVGKGPDRVDSTLDAPATMDSAAVMGLKGGINYFLTVRAMRADDKGPASSPAVVARTLGMEVSITPQESSLLAQWTFPDTTPLSSFLLEYGSAEGEFSEKRLLDGAMRAYTMKDLLTQPYLIRLTPISTTGESLTDLAVTTQGTPLPPAGFSTSTDEITSTKTDTVAPDNALHEGAPAVTDSGMPGIPVRLVLGFTAIVLGLYWYRRKKSMRETREFLQAMNRKYHS